MAGEFTMDLAKCFLDSNIPLHKIAYPSIVGFVKKRTKYAAPSESKKQITMRALKR